MDGFIGEIRAFCFDYEPVGWIYCDGRSLNMSTNQALYSILGYQYGGSGSNFNIPKIPGKVLIGSGTLHYNSQTTGGTYVVGNKQINGETVVLNNATMPAHNHTFSVEYVSSGAYRSLVKVPASGSYVSNFGTNTTPVKAGKGYIPASSDLKMLSPLSLSPSGAIAPAPHNNMQPYLALNYCICIEGEYPVKP